MPRAVGAKEVEVFLRSVMMMMMMMMSITIMTMMVNDNYYHYNHADDNECVVLERWLQMAMKGQSMALKEDGSGYRKCDRRLVIVGRVL
eukprot:3195200-Amphidinium_carterae.1